MLDGGKKIGLVLAGGGARGAYQVGVLKAVMEIWGKDENPFDILTGVSVGSINAAALASRASNAQAGIAWLEDLWINLRSCEIYRTDFASIASCSLRWLFSIPFGRLGLPVPRSLLNPTPLANLLKAKLDRDKIDHAIANDDLDSLAITASSYGDGRAKTFFECANGTENWSRTRRDGVRAEIGIEHILASVALPIIFPPQDIEGEQFGDGGIRLTAPLSPAIHLGAQKILVVQTRDEIKDEPDLPMDCPSVGAIIGSLMDVVFNDNLNADAERAKRINRTLRYVEEDKCEEAGLRHLDIHVIRPTQDVRKITAKHAPCLPWTIRGLLRGIGGWGGDWRIPSYLLFEPSYIRALINLGYEDTMGQKSDISDFLLR